MRMIEKPEPERRYQPEKFRSSWIILCHTSKFDEMNYAKMAVKEPDIEGEGDHLL